MVLDQISSDQEMWRMFNKDENFKSRDLTERLNCYK